MAKLLNWNPEPFLTACIKGSMDRLEAAAEIIRDDAKRRLAGKVQETWKEHGPYKKGAYTGAYWTERRHGELAATIRVVRKKDSSVRNIWIMAGNKKVWWAVQTEYGRGGWRGGAKPFLRPALQAAVSTCKGILEGS